jgi:ASC-1-like (ASCH) protein
MSAVFQFKPICGERRIERRVIVQDYLDRIRARLYGDQKDQMGRILGGESKCRLVLLNGKPAGVFVYKNELSNAYQQTGFSDALELELFQTMIKTDEAFECMLQMLEEVKEMAKDLSPRSIVIKLHRDETKVAEFFKGRGFDESRVDKSHLLMGHSLRHEKRKRDESPVVLSPAPPPHPPQYPPDRGPIGVTLKLPYIRAIQERRKTVEGRINMGMFKSLKRGSTVRFFSGDVGVLCTVTRVSNYPSFREMLQSEGYAKCIPEAKSLEDAVQIYDRIPTYSEKAIQHGVLALHIQKQEG